MTSDRDANPFILKLRDPRERFLARVLEACFEKRWRTAEDFLQAFPPGVLMDALEAEPEIRVRLLVEAGIPAKIAARLSPSAAREDLEIAVEENLTTAAVILDLVPIDVRVQRLDSDGLWRFAAEGDWLLRSGQSDQARRAAAERVTAVIEAALTEELITTRDLLNAISAEELAASLSEEQLRTVFVFALQSAQQATPVDEGELLALLDMQKLIADLPIEQTWNRVVIERVASPYGLSAVPGAPSPSNVRASKSGPATERAQRLITPPLPAMRGATPIPPAPGRPVSVPIPPAPGRPVVSVLEPRTLRQQAPRARAQTLPDEAVEVMVEEEAAEELDSDLEYTQPNFTEPVFSGQQRPANAGRAPARSSTGEKAPGARGSDGARRRAATDKLRKLGRLPPNHEYLSLAILRSIERMYEEIKTRRGKAARAQCVRECFDNPAHLRTGMLALLELLDPHLVPLLENGDPDTLIDALLAQERALWQRERASTPAPAPTGLETLPGTRQRPPPSRPLGSAVPLTRLKGPFN